MRASFKILVAVLFCLGMSGYSLATDYYVDNTCAHNGNGMNQTCASSGGQLGPFNSLANAQIAVVGSHPGDRLLLKAGQTFKGQLVVGASGAAGNPFVISSHGSGAQPLITGSEQLTSWNPHSGSIYKASCPWSPLMVFQDGNPLSKAGSVGGMSSGSFFADGVNLYVWVADGSNPSGHTIDVPRYGERYTGLVAFGSQSYVTVDGVEMRYANGSTVTDSGMGNTIVNCTISKSFYWSILGISNNSFTANNNYIHDSGLDGYGGAGTAITIVSGNNFMIDNNYIVDNYGEAIGIIASLGPQSNGTVTRNRLQDVKFNTYIYIEAMGGADLRNITFSDNYIWATKPSTLGGQAIHGIQMALEGSSYPGNIYDCKITGNIIQGLQQGMAFLIGYSGPGVFGNNTWANNTISNCANGIWIFGNETQINGNTIANNIIYNSGTALYLSPGSSTNNTIDYNLYSPATISWLGSSYNLANFKAATGKETHGIEANPLFVNPSGDWTGFRLQAGSPAIDAGANLGTIYNLALDPNKTTWPPSTVDQNSYGPGWEIGAYVYRTNVNVLLPPTGLRLVP